MRPCSPPQSPGRQLLGRPRDPVAQPGPCPLSWSPGFPSDPREPEESFKALNQTMPCLVILRSVLVCPVRGCAPTFKGA